MEESILRSVAKIIGITEDYKVFDPDLIMHINAMLAVLYQLGAISNSNFAISDDSTTWGDVLRSSNLLSPALTYVALRVRLIFDPPSSSSAAQSFKETTDELAWRLTVTDDELNNG